ncbi:MAG TPA: adenylosuccinate synthase, partial [Clostridia bacterium]|nr:adenylosuccinate synthase [Clostridia bacterium]
VIGAQWGDEGKGRFVDYLAANADIVVRYQGGNNAGHTVEVGNKQYKLHLIPAGILYPEKLCVIANGVVVDLEGLAAEIERLEKGGISCDNIRISDRCHLVMPYHKVLDQLVEKARGQSQIGTTLKGIGPAYMDKAERTGIRIADLLDDETFKEVLKENVEHKNNLITKIYNAEPVSFDEIYDKFSRLGEKLKKYFCDTVELLNDAVHSGKSILFEGAQGTLLDLDYGTYPYVTSSHPISGGVCVGSGISPKAIDQVVGVAKAYTTRVGKGPFVTEILDHMGSVIREKGNEYGTTTGRPRRCGWFDAVAVRYAVNLSGITGLALSRMDTLGGIGNVKICTGYELDGESVRTYPASLKALSRCTPIYEEYEGWDDKISDIRDFKKLPSAARKYIERIEELCSVPVVMIGVGAKRDELIVR